MCMCDRCFDCKFNTKNMLEPLFECKLNTNSKLKAKQSKANSRYQVRRYFVPAEIIHLLLFQLN